MIGTTIAHYRVLSLLGRGGMGEVYLAENLRLQKKVALKFLSPELSRDGLSLERLRGEARAAAELDHPNIARIHDMQEGDGRHFLVMEYVEGETLSDRLADGGPLDSDEAGRIVVAIAAGLEHAHGHGIIHRDIKSANVILKADGEVKILDFGLALRADTSTLTQLGAVLGTLAYMSPEQLRGTTIDARTDLWSLGVVFYECLTGQRPFDGPTAESTIHNILRTAPRAIWRAHPRVIAGFEEVVGRLLEKDPERRYGTAGDLLRDLRSIRSSDPTVVWRLRARRLSRHWLMAGVGIALLTAPIPVAIRWQSARTIGGAGGPRLAVVGFSDLSAEPDSLAAAGLTAMVQVGLADLKGCEMVSPEYLRDILRRRFGEAVRTAAASQVLQLARDADAAFIVSGEIVEASGATRVLWRITETKRGKVVASGKAEAVNRMDLADMVSAGAVARMASLTRSVDPATVVSARGLVSSNVEAYRHYIAGLVARDDGRTADAKRDFLRAVEIDSTFALGALELSRSFDLNSEREEARRAAMQASRHRDNLNDKERHLLEAYLFQIDSKARQAIAAYDGILARWPDCREALVQRAEAAFFNNDPRAASEAARKGTVFYPDDPNLLGTLTQSLLFLGQWEEALTYGRIALARRQDYYWATDVMGDLFLLLAEPDSARAYYELTRALKPQEFASSFNFSVLAYAEGNLDSAIAIQEEMLRDARFSESDKWYLRNVTGPLGLPFLYVDAGMIHKALECVTPGTGNSLPARLWVYVYAGLPDEITRASASGARVEESEAGSERYPGASGFMSHMAAVTGDLGDAEKYYSEWMQGLSLNPEITWQEAWKYEVGAMIALKSARVTEAEEELRNLERVGYDRLSWDALRIGQLQAEVRAASNDLPGAIRSLEGMVRIYGGRTLARLQLARYYERAGRNEEARRHYRECLRLWRNADSDYPYLARARERLMALGG